MQIRFGLNLPQLREELKSRKEQDPPIVLQPTGRAQHLFVNSIEKDEVLSQGLGSPRYVVTGTRFDSERLYGDNNIFAEGLARLQGNGQSARYVVPADEEGNTDSFTRVER